MSDEFVILYKWKQAVSQEPQIYLTPSFSEVEKYVSESHIVSCKSERGLSMMWSKDKQQITVSKGRVHVEKAPGGKGVALFFEGILSTDKGNYTCSATIDNEPVHSSFRLVVIKPLKFLDTSPVQVAKETESVVMRCEVEGDPEPSITWSAKGKVIDGNKYKVVGDGLAIEKVTLEDEGDYHCRAFQISNVKSNTIERTITLKVQHKPAWNGTTDVSYGFLTGTVNLTCELQIVNESVFGNYTCKAENPLGKMEHKITLLKGAKPAIPEVNEHSSTPDSIKITIEGPSEEELKILSYRVQYLRKQELTTGWEKAQEKEFPKGESPYTISGLDQNTEYVVKVAARNAAGYSDFTETKEFITDKVHADPVTGNTNSANYLSSKASQVIAIITLHNIIFITGELQHHL
ncbi:hypothetical protein C0J52_01614 [Blattella germanica]|nr:hypothetical protein C0J52_01614 [Blattella germanica]